MDDDLELVTVFEAVEPGLIAMVRSILEDAEIPFVTKGEEIQDLFGYGRLFSGFNPIVGAVEFQVRPRDEKTARSLLDDLSSPGERAT
ncbi:MAG: DUF2007 domain-containing protein [Thermoanaerobaculia bacterium]